MLNNIYKFFALSFILSIIFAGCAENNETARYRVQCDCGQSRQALVLNDGMDEMTDDWTVLNTACNSLAEELVGRWTGLGDASIRRFVMDADGNHKIQEKRGSKWVTILDGRYWVEYELSHGLLRPELHMSLPDNDVYVVRYHLSGDELHLEESTDSGPEMVFKKSELK